MKKCTEYTIGKTRVLQESDPYPGDYTDDLGTYTNDIKPGVYIRSAGDFYERLPAEMERDIDGRFLGKGEPEYSTYSREYNGIIPCNHVPFNPKDWSHVSRKDKSEVIKKYGSLKNASYAYAIEDCRRLENLGNTWEYVFITVETTIHTSTGLSDTIRKSLSGVEYEYGPENRKCREDIVRDLIDQNIADLEKMGFSMDEIKKSTDNPVYPKEW